MVSYLHFLTFWPVPVKDRLSLVSIYFEQHLKTLKPIQVSTLLYDAEKD